MLRVTILSALLLSQSAYAGVWTCAASCYVLPNLSTNSPIFRYVAEQAPSAKEAFEKLSATCLDLYAPRQGRLAQETHFTQTTTPIYIYQPVRISEICVKDESEAATAAPAPAAS